MKKRLLCLLLSVLISCSLLLQAAPLASAADASDSISGAKGISLGATYSDSISDSYDKDYFKFTLSSAGTVNVTFTRPNLGDSQEYWTAFIYNSKAEEVCFYSFDGISTSTSSYLIGLAAGTYYIRFAGGRLSDSSDRAESYRFSTQTYSFCLNYTKTGYCENENNETIATATAIEVNKTITGSINDRYDKDYFKFTLSSAGTVNIKFTRPNLGDSQEYWTAFIYNSKAEEVCFYSFDGISTSTSSYLIGLAAGTYYIRFAGGRLSDSSDRAESYRFSTQTYSFCLNYTKTGYCENENNETIATATAIEVNKTITGSINDRYDKDYFKFTLSSAGTVNIKFTRPNLGDSQEYWTAFIYNSKAEEVCFYSFDGISTSTSSYLIGLAAGTYYIRFAGGRLSDSSDRAESYRFSTQTYSFCLNYTKTGYCENENNETIADATPIALDSTITGSINDRYDKDYFKFTVNSAGNFALAFTCPDLGDSQEYWTAFLLDEKGNQVKSYSLLGDSASTEITMITRSIPAGVYYIRFAGGRLSDNSDRAESYRFSTETYCFKLHVHHFAKTGDVKPTCTTRGYYVYTCSDCGNSYEEYYASALGHSYAGGFCTRCGATDPNGSCNGGSRCPGHGFVDMPSASNWAHKGLDFCIARGLLSGTSNTTISPNMTMNRAMLVTILYSLDGKPTVTARSPFTDVPNNSWYSKPVIWAAANGIVSGSGNGKFNPNGSVTREQIAVMLRSYARYKGYSTSASVNLSRYPDAGSISSWAKDAFSWAVAAGLISGTSVGSATYLNPKNNATRAQVATILMQFVTKLVER